MKKLIFIFFLNVCFLFTSLSISQSGASSSNALSKQPLLNVTDFDKKATQIQENFKKMQEQMDGIRLAKDPQEKQRLLQDHWVTMQGNMKNMDEIRDSSFMGCCGGARHMMGWERMGPYYSKLNPKDIEQREYMMDQYMGMQQNMMYQMMMRHHYMWINEGR
jgi:hypothetical protein